MARAVWIDTYETLNQVPEAEKFRIRANDRTVYSGKAFPRPGRSDVEVYMNDVAANIVKINKPWFQFHDLVTQDENPVTFYLDAYRNSSWENVSDIAFFYDWSYEMGRAFSAPAGSLALPINGRMCNGMVFTFSTYQQPEGYQLGLYSDSGGYLMSLYPSSLQDETYPLSGTLTYNVATILSTAPQTAAVNVLGVEYPIVPACHRFALYYLNEIGGWDFLLIEGNHQITDGVTRWNQERVYNNSGDIERGKVTYAEEIVRRYTLHTGNLSDDEASRMHHLLNSPDVWLLDMEDGRYFPVTLTNTDTPYKTFISEGRTMFVYEITAESSNYMERR